MKSSRYTASVIFDGRCLKMSQSDDLNRLTAFLLNYIESTAPNSIGEIFDNEKGQIIQRCKKSFID